MEPPVDAQQGLRQAQGLFWSRCCQLLPGPEASRLLNDAAKWQVSASCGPMDRACRASLSRVLFWFTIRAACGLTFPARPERQSLSSEMYRAPLKGNNVTGCRRILKIR